MIIKEKIEKILEKQNKILEKTKLVLSDFENNLNSFLESLIVDFEKIFDLDNAFKLKVSTKNQPYVSIIKGESELNLIGAFENYPKDIFSLLTKSSFTNAILEALDDIEDELEKLEKALDDLSFEKKVKVEVITSAVEKVKEAQIKVVENIKEAQNLTEEKNLEEEKQVEMKDEQKEETFIKDNLEKSSSLAEEENLAEIPSSQENIEQTETVQDETMKVSSQEIQVTDISQEKDLEVSSEQENINLQPPESGLQEIQDLSQKEFQEENISQEQKDTLGNNQLSQEIVEESQLTSSQSLEENAQQIKNIKEISNFQEVQPETSQIQKQTELQEEVKEIDQKSYMSPYPEEILIKYPENKLKAYEEELNKVIKSLASTPEIMPAIKNNESLRSILKSRLVKIPEDVFNYLLNQIEVSEEIKQVLIGLRG